MLLFCADVCWWTEMISNDVWAYICSHICSCVFVFIMHVCVWQCVCVYFYLYARWYNFCCMVMFILFKSESDMGSSWCNNAYNSDPMFWCGKDLSLDLPAFNCWHVIDTSDTRSSLFSSSCVQFRFHPFHKTFISPTWSYSIY